MSDFEKFKQMNPDEIYKKTFLLPKVIKALADEKFEELGNRTKALGFVSILERELHLDLSELREKIENYFSQDGNVRYEKVAETGEGVAKPKKRRNKLFYLLLLLGALLGALLYYFLYVDDTLLNKMESLFSKSSSSNSYISSSPDAFISSSSSSISYSTQVVSVSSVSSSKTQEKVEEVEALPGTTTTFKESAFKEETATTTTSSSSSTMSVAQVETREVETSSSVEEEVSSSSVEVVVEEEEVSSQKAVPTTLEIVPKAKLWIGVIYLDNHSKKTYLTSSPVQLDTSRDQLIYTGHGKFKIVADGEVIEDLNARGKQRYIYRNGQLEKIDRETFRSYNRGRDW